jgi:glycolate oxidase
MFKSLDVVVPRSLIPALVKKIQGISERYQIQVMSFGHAGDGNVHVLLFKAELTDEQWETVIDKAETDLYRETIELGGKLTAEHGIGLLRKSFLPLNLDPHQIEILKGLKKAFDPNNILNPGKIFDL